MQVKIGDTVNSHFYGLIIDRNVNNFEVRCQGWDGRDGIVARISPEEAIRLVEYLTDELALDGRGTALLVRRDYA